MICININSAARYMGIKLIKYKPNMDDSDIQITSNLMSKIVCKIDNLDLVNVVLRHGGNNCIEYLCLATKYEHHKYKFFF